MLLGRRCIDVLQASGTLLLVAIAGLWIKPGRRRKKTPQRRLGCFTAMLSLDGERLCYVRLKVNSFLYLLPTLLSLLPIGDSPPFVLHAFPAAASSLNCPSRVRLGKPSLWLERFCRPKSLKGSSPVQHLRAAPP